jgi:hypothetical protein
MKNEQPNKLVLNQETLRNLNRENLKTVAGGFMTGLPKTCPECATPPQTDTC